MRTGLGPGALLLTKAQYPIRFGNHDPCIGMGILWQPDDPVEVRIGNAIGSAIFIADNARESSRSGQTAKRAV